jgi:hypothetical protein
MVPYTPQQAAPVTEGESTMMKIFFATRRSEDQEFNVELERAIKTVHERMERMLQSETLKRQRYATIESTPYSYR